MKSTGQLVTPWPVSDKRSSTGNLCYFTDQFDNHPWENPELNQTLRNTVVHHYLTPFFQLSFESCVSTIARLIVVLLHITDWFVKRVTVMFRPVGEKAARRGERRRRVRRRGTRRPHCRPWQVSFFTVIDILRYSSLIDILKYSPMCPQAFQLSNCIFELACLLSN